MIFFVVAFVLMDYIISTTLIFFLISKAHLAADVESRNLGRFDETFEGGLSCFLLF